MIELPRTDEAGKPRISYSQVKLFNDPKSFNLQVEGELEYMAIYFLNHSFSDTGWGQFGKDVEAYIADREKADCFTDKERATLEKIEPLGVTSDKFSVDFGEFVLTGIIDDRLEDWSKIRDYKTASKNSKKQYETNKYVQLDLYAMAAIQETGKIPELEVCVIERKGNANYGGGRDALTVGSNIWYIDRETTEERLEMLREEIRETVVRISEYYKIFKNLNK